MNEEEFEKELDRVLEDIDFSELDTCIGDDAWAIGFENTGSIEVDVDFFL